MSAEHDPLRTSNRLHDWALQAEGAASSLLHLYTKLEDGIQRHRSIRVLDIMRAWMAQYPSKPQHLPPSPPIQPEDQALELNRWRIALEASTGIQVFLSLGQGDKRVLPGLRGQITQFTKASQAALHGLHCAFPEKIAKASVQQAIVQVLEAYRAAISQVFPKESSPEVMDALLDSLEKALRR